MSETSEKLAEVCARRQAEMGYFVCQRNLYKTTDSPTVDYLCFCSFPMSPASTQAKISVVYIGHHMVDEWKTEDVGGGHSVFADFFFQAF